MSIERNNNRETVTIVCDTCGEEFPGEPGQEFGEVWGMAKRDGWRVRKIAGEWMHGCPKPRCVPT